jgi:aspartate/tyrosine/aromatic aminotransferase
MANNKPNWIDELNKIEKTNRLFVLVLSKDDVEASTGLTLTEPQWEEVLRQSRKIDFVEIHDQLCEIAREIK